MGSRSRPAPLRVTASIGDFGSMQSSRVAEIAFIDVETGLEPTQGKAWNGKRILPLAA
jgi:hypothetical protein